MGGILADAEVFIIEIRRLCQGFGAEYIFAEKQESGRDYIERLVESCFFVWMKINFVVHKG